MEKQADLSKFTGAPERKVRKDTPVPEGVVSSAQAQLLRFELDAPRPRDDDSILKG